jgi:hypothetical protein
MNRPTSQTARKLAAVAVMAGIVVAFAFGGCESKPEPAGGTPAVILISGDTGPWIVPCGCAANQAGGLARRATLLQQQGSNVIYLDVGGAAAGNTDYFLQKFTAVVKGEKLMGIAAHNLGKGELELGLKTLKVFTAGAVGMPFISANARTMDGKPIVPPLMIAPAGSRRIAVVGVVSPKYATKEIQVDDPRVAVAETLNAAKGQYDSAIVLAYLPEDELMALAAALPEVDAVIGGPTGQAVTPRLVGPTLVGSATNKGKFLVKLTGQAKGYTGEVLEVSHTYAEDAGQIDNLKQYLRALESADLPAEQTGLVQPLVNPPAGYAIAGSQSCVECHKEDHDGWQHSKHGHAGQTLLEKGFHVDAYCLQCHTTGFGLPGGFVSPKRTPGLAVVGCESCHGPSAAHVKDEKVRTPFNAFDQCIRCHDQENSPTFNREAYWEKIKHGKKVEK